MLSTFKLLFITQSHEQLIFLKDWLCKSVTYKKMYEAELK